MSGSSASTRAESRSLSPRKRGWPSSIFPLGVRRTPGSRGSSGPKSIPCGVSSRAAEGEPSRPGAEGIPVGAAAEVDVEEPLLPGARLEGGEQLVRIPARDRGVRIGAASTERVECDLPVERLEVGRRAEAADDRGERKHDLPLVACVGGERQRRRRVVGHVPHRGRVDGQVVVRALERRGRRQDHVGLPGRLVEIEVDADEALELAERRLAAAARSDC